MARSTAISAKERSNIDKAQLVARYVDPEEKIIGVSSGPDKARAANRSSSIKILTKEFSYKIQMLIPDKK
jgi:hypothetical protein